jgi:hypothetical protein
LAFLILKYQQIILKEKLPKTFQLNLHWLKSSATPFSAQRSGNLCQQYRCRSGCRYSSLNTEGFQPKEILHYLIAYDAVVNISPRVRGNKEFLNILVGTREREHPQKALLVQNTAFPYK